MRFLDIGFFNLGISVSSNFALRGSKKTIFFTHISRIILGFFFNDFCGHFGVKDGCKICCEKELLMGSEKNELQTL